jgi:ubiquinone/menaquinone biosynthesis C-methylase UbiE
VKHKMVKPNRLATLVVAVLAAGACVASAESVEVPDRVAAKKQIEEAAAIGDLDTMAERAEEIAFAELVDYLEASYELLRIQCRQGDESAALDTVQAMLDAGFWDYRRLLNDDDLALINSTDRLKGMVRAAWAEGYISMLERDSRDAMQFPDRIMESLALEPGDVVADVGAGSGYFTVRLAAAVGGAGRVIATDIRQEMLDYIAARLDEGGIDNVELVKVEPDDPGLPAGEIDTVLMVDVMHYVRDRAAYAKKLRAALSPGGRVVVIDFRFDPEAEREFAPPPEQQVPRATLDEEMKDAGFVVAEAFDFLPEQYFVIYRAAE